MEGIDETKVGEWFEANVAEATPPLAFELIAGGRSNLTYRVTDSAGNDFVLRRPPTSHVLPTAHDMGREHRIVSALGPTPVPVAPTFGYCGDDSVNGAPFYVMGFVPGHILRDAETARKVLDEDGRRRAGESLIDVLADLHAVDVDAVGLGDLARREAYIERQLKRWYGQFRQSQEGTGRPVPLVDELHDLLSARMPDQVGDRHRPRRLPAGQHHAGRRRRLPRRARLGDLHAGRPTGRPRPAHGLLGRAGRRRPRSRPRPDGRSRLPEPRRACGPGTATVPGATSRRSTSTSPSATGSSPASLEGVYARYAGGAMGGDRSGVDAFSDQVARLAEAGKAAADRL